MKNILLLVHDDDGQEARLQVALDLTRALDGHLVCVDVAQMIYAPDGLYGTADNIMLVDELARETANHARLVARLTSEAVPWNWVERLGDLAGSVSRAAGLADLIVVNRALDHDPIDMAAVAAAVAVKTHKPVVAVGDAIRCFNAYGRALIAWDGSLPAMSALSASVPLLKLATLVHILEIDIAADATPAEDAAEYLSRHGIHAKIVRLSADEEHADVIIRRHALDFRASYCVMGAYGHARLVEAIFGGVTRRMLKTAEFPLVLVH